MSVRKSVWATALIAIVALSVAAYYSTSLSPARSSRPPAFSGRDDVHHSGLSADGTYSGLGQSLNVSHHANRTDSNVDLSFSNGSWAAHAFELEDKGWTGRALGAHVRNLVDERNWVNGTFNYGNDDGDDYKNPNKNDDDSSFTNGEWSLTKVDNGGASGLAGNYYDAGGAPEINNSLELLIAGRGTPDPWTYDHNDRVDWIQNFDVPRGRCVDALLKFRAFPAHLMDINTFELRFLVDDVLVYAIGTQSLKMMGYKAYHNFSIPMGLWINTTDVFSGDLKDIQHKLTIRLIYLGPTGYYDDPITDKDYQQVLVSDVELVIKAEVKPSQVDLNMNGVSVGDAGFGQGFVLQQGSWTQSEVTANFTAVNNFTRTLYFTADLNCSIDKYAPTSTWEPSAGSLGSEFEVTNGSDARWEFYCQFSVPTGFEEETFALTYPGDWTLTWVSSPQLPGTNQLASCTTPAPGLLVVPVSSITPTPDGFWKFAATSPNYVLSGSTFRNSTPSDAPPGPNEWTPSTEFYAGDWLNVTASLNTTGNFTALGSTWAMLELRFPNGTAWVAERVLVGTDGTARFSPVKIPPSGGAYVAGAYDLFVTWNSSTAGVPAMNQTGVLHSKITIKHFSVLVPDQPFVEEFLEGTTLRVNARLLDAVTGEPVVGAQVVVENLTGGVKQMSEIALGYYTAQLEHDPSAQFNHSLSLNATHPHFSDATTEVIVEVALLTRLEAPEAPSVTVPWGNNVTVHVNYTEETSAVPVTGGSLQVNWPGAWHVIETGGGLYEVEANTSTLSTNQLYPLVVSVDDYGYEARALSIDVKVVPRETYLDVWADGSNASVGLSAEVLVHDVLNLSIWFKDSASSGRVEAASITLDLEPSTYVHSTTGGRHQFLVNSTALGVGVRTVEVVGHAPGYKNATTSLSVRVLARESNVTLLVEGQPASSCEVPITSAFTLQARFVDALSGQLVEDASFNASGLPAGSFEITASGGSCTLSVDTKAAGLGVHFVTVLASGSAHQTASAPFKLTVAQIRASAALLNASPEALLVEPGSDFELEVVINDLDFGGRLTGANVTYKWRFGSGSLTDPDGDGVYVAVLENVPEGTHAVHVTVDLGPDYSVGELQVSFTAAKEPTPALPTWVTFTSGGVAAGVSALILSYQLVFRFPKAVRVVRGVRRALKKRKKGAIEVKDPKALFSEAYLEAAGRHLPQDALSRLREKKT